VELVPLVKGTPPVATPANAEIVALAEKLTDRPATAAAYCTEAPYFTELGMQTVVLGPGHIDQAHQPDEYLEAAFIDPTLHLLKHMIDHYCLR
jgi:acetylornithine deacetylase